MRACVSQCAGWYKPRSTQEARMPSDATACPSPLARLPNHKLLLGLFLPMQQGAWSPSRAPRSTSWTFDYIARCTRTAEQFGFDLAFGLAQWLRKGGAGGAVCFPAREE